MTCKEHEEEYDEEEYDSFDPFFTEEAKLEVRVDNYGVNFVGNAEGYLALSRLFTYLSQISNDIRISEDTLPELNTVKGYGAYHFRDFIKEKRIKNKDYIFEAGPLKQNQPELHDQELLFWISDQIGSKFWLEELSEEDKDQSDA
ncbi:MULTISPECIES: hypothetical protein [unclassified Exiguobacterium]|uniref:hypothetical protein n=1 Tax=unclassified Exiguobacterium TaxID=2644629 RepID=UPI0008D31214|nr:MULTISPECIES: hypothetical protein [unclassified Exiguobacterium]OGX79256.1 hypothetical protein A6395_07605 [Exiguobacterium sp. SH31]TCI59101.1 hypothetical protein EVJ21_14285 [Exiguobacterium sp. SH0S2]